MIKVDCAVCGMPLDPFDLKPHKCLSKENPMKPHKHAELIKAWADGAEIQVRMFNSGKGWSEWEDHPLPCWTTNGRIHFEYRIKPEPKPDLVVYAVVKEYYLSRTEQEKSDNLKLTFDGETGELKSAEVLV